MSVLNLSAVMDAIAAQIVSTGVMSRAFEWPTEQVNPPCAVVSYPTGDNGIEFDTTFGRGSDKATFPVYLLVGKVSDRTARDRLSALLTGATGIKNHLDGNLGGAVQTARVTTVRVEDVTVAGVSYLAAVVEIEVYT